MQKFCIIVSHFSVQNNNLHFDCVKKFQTLCVKYVRCVNANIRSEVKRERYRKSERSVPVIFSLFLSVIAQIKIRDLNRRGTRPARRTRFGAPRVPLAHYSEIWNHGDILSVTSSIMPMRPVNFTHYTPIIRFLAESDRDLVLSPDVITRCRADEWMEELCGVRARVCTCRICALSYTCM